MSTLLSVLLYLHFLTPNATITQSGLNSIASANQAAIEQISSDQELLNNIASEYASQSESIIVINDDELDVTQTPEPNDGDPIIVINDDELDVVAH